MSSSPTQLRRRLKDSNASSSSSLSSSSSGDDIKTVQAKRQLKIDSSDKIAGSPLSKSPVIYPSAGFICALALCIRFMVALHSYSGFSTPPKFGDFEAQRHWMEITVHTPIKEWYRPTQVNDLTWWGLDYPPLSAYWAFITGKV